MRDPAVNVSILQKQINGLQLENQLLKNILDRSGISYAEELRHLRDPEAAEDFDPDQGGRIIHPSVFTVGMVRTFLSRFWSRHDVYAKRSVNKSGEAGYFPQCCNFWTEVCPRKHGQKMICKNCSYRSDKELETKDILAHLQGKSQSASDVIGVYR